MTVEEWIRLFEKMPKGTKLNPGLPEEKIRTFLRENDFAATDEYIQFMTFANGGSLFGGKLFIWEIPESEDRDIPDWKSVLHMNREVFEKMIPKSQKIFMFASDYLGGYTGMWYSEKHTDILHIYPGTEGTHMFKSFTDWLEYMWMNVL